MLFIVLHALNRRHIVCSCEDNDIILSRYHKKSLKIPKGYSEAINRRTDNTMAKRKETINNTPQKNKDRAARYIRITFPKNSSFAH